MPKLAQALLDEFGKAVKHARSLRGWQLSDVSNRIAEMDRTRPGQKVTAPAITFLSDIEKGKRSISPPTVGKLIQALDLPESWLTRFLTAAPDEADEETPKDREAERLIRRAGADPNAPETPEPLLILLAEEWSGQKFTDPSLAYNALKSALEAAADLKAQGELPSNSSDQLQAVLRRVSELNDAGQMDEADVALQQAVKRNKAETERNAAEAEILIEAQIMQDRIRNRPSEAGVRKYSHLLGKDPHLLESGVIDEARRLLSLGRKSSNTFDFECCESLLNCYSRSIPNLTLQIKVMTAESRWRRGHRIGEKGIIDDVLRILSGLLIESDTSAEGGHALELRFQLALAHWALGELSGDRVHFRESFLLASRIRKADLKRPDNWRCADLYNIIGISLSHSGLESNNTFFLSIALKAHALAASLRLGNGDEHNYLTSLNNIAVVQRWLGALKEIGAYLESAERNHDLVLSKVTRSSSTFLWAVTKWNLAAVFLARYKILGNRRNLVTARLHALEAREAFADGSEGPLGECDRLLAQIDAA